MGYYKPIDTRTPEQKLRAAFDRILANVKAAHPEHSAELCEGIARRILAERNSGKRL